MNKIIITFFVFFMTQCVIAADYSISYSMLTMHTFDRSVKFENKIDKNGILMYNPIIGLSYKNSNFLIGKDSVDSQIFGYYYQYNKFIFGAYSHIYQNWNDKKLSQTIAFPVTKRWGVIPIFGIKQNLFTKDNLNFDTIVTPLTINLTVSISL